MLSPSRCDSVQVITVLKILLFGYSIIFLIIGVVLFSFGLWGLLNLKDYFALAPQMTTHAVHVLIGTGITIFVVGIFGFVATLHGSRLMLNLYAVLLTIVYIAELVAGISGFTYRHEIRAKVEKAFEDALTYYIDTNTPPTGAPTVTDTVSTSANWSMSSAVDAIQKKLQCCGVKNFTDWSSTTFFTTSGIPTSCCKDLSNCATTNLKDVSTAGALVHSKGCFVLVSEAVRTNMAIIAGSSFGLAFFQLIGLSMASFLSQYLKFNHYEIP